MSKPPSNPLWCLDLAFRLPFRILGRPGPPRSVVLTPMPKPHSNNSRDRYVKRRRTLFILPEDTYEPTVSNAPRAETHLHASAISLFINVHCSLLPNEYRVALVWGSVSDLRPYSGRLHDLRVEPWSRSGASIQGLAVPRSTRWKAFRD